MTNVKNSKKFKLKCKRIKLILTDVDGVLTDGGRYYSSDGEKLKKFHVRDGMGVNLLLRNKIKTVIMTKENSKIVKKWANEMNVSTVYSGVKKKESKLPKICKDFGLTKKEIAFIGDDINDLELMKLVGLSVSPEDAIDFVRQKVDYVCRISSGKGVFREVADLILITKFPNKKKWY